MQRWTWILALAGLFGGLGLTQYSRQGASTGELDPDRALLLGLQREVQRLHAKLEESRERLARLDEGQGHSAELDVRIRTLESELTQSRDKLTRQRELLAALESSSREAALRAVDQEFLGFARALDSKWEGLRGQVDEVVGLAREHEGALRELRELRAGQRRDTARMWSELLGPTVQLSGTATVGSGVLLPSQPVEDGGHRTYLLTAWHVVRDIQSDPSRPVEPVPVHIYRPDGSYQAETARLLAHDATIDAALLLMNTDRAFAHGARLASREDLEQVAIFGAVYAVGCPLGNDPIPTYGEVADLRHRVDGEPYWMISAPTYIGNSGGGIFDAETHDLIGIFSKIYTHGAVRPTVIPHMGLVTPLARIYDWLETVGFGDVVPGSAAPLAPPESTLPRGVTQADLDENP